MEDANPIRSDSLEVNEAEDGLVVFDAVHDTVHHLNPSASLLFDLCDGTRDVATIAGLLGEAFGLDSAPAHATESGLRELADRRLIRWQFHSDAAS